MDRKSLSQAVEVYRQSLSEDPPTISAKARRKVRNKIYRRDYDKRPERVARRKDRDHRRNSGRRVRELVLLRAGITCPEEFENLPSGQRASIRGLMGRVPSSPSHRGIPEENHEQSSTGSGGH